MKKKNGTSQLSYLLSIILWMVVPINCNPSHSDSPYKLPDLSLLDTSGEPVSLRSFQGKVLVVDIWATWCEPCSKSVPVLEKFKTKVGEEFQFVGINTDQNVPPETVEEYATKWGMTYPTLLDPHHVFVNHFQVEGLPGLFVFSKSGIFLYKQYGLKESDLEGLVARISAWKAVE